MAEKTTAKKTTKDLILDAAFSFCEKPRFDSFSLSELAAKVGISKTAIYRHFKDKDALYEAMKDRFLDELAACLEPVQAARSCNSDRPALEEFAALIAFFTENSCYINYAIGCISSEDGFQRRVEAALEMRGLKNIGGCHYMADSHRLVITNFDDYACSVYSGLTIFMLIKLREKILGEGLAVMPADYFGKQLVLLLTEGLEGTVPKEDPLYPAAISQGRFAELDELCAIEEDELPAEDRIFTALAAVITKYKITGVTVERIADELHMAKSSLYEYFVNKNEMIRSLILKELYLLDAYIRENAAEARNFSEYLYIQMATECAYLERHPSIIPICGWLVLTSPDDAIMQEEGRNSAWEKILPDILEKPDLGIPLTSHELLMWLGVLPFSLMAHGYKHGLSDGERKQLLKKIFDCVQNGTAPKGR